MIKEAEKKGLQRYYGKYKSRPTAYFDPCTGQLFSEVSKVHKLGLNARLAAVLEVCDCQVLYLLPDTYGAYPSAPDYYSIAGLEVKKYLSKRKSAMVVYKGKTINVYPLGTWCDVSPGMSLKQAILGMREIQSQIERTFQPQKVTSGQVEKFAIPLLATPAQMASDLLKRCLPYEQVYESLPEQEALTILLELGQGRIETFHHGRDWLARIFDYDGRWEYAACLRRVPVGRMVHDTVPEVMPFAPGFYRVQATVPANWYHIGLLPQKNTTGNTRFVYPNQPGDSFESWCTSDEVQLAEKQGWHLEIKERILWPDTYKLPEPLKLIGERLIRLRMDIADKLPEPQKSMLRSASRNMLLQLVGSFHRVDREYDGYTSDPESIPDSYTLPQLLDDGETWRYTLQEKLSPLQLMMAQVHWTAFIWGKARRNLAEQALQVPFEDLVALRVDAIWTAREMGWPDSGKVGVFRREALKNDTDLAWPKNTAEMVDLVQRVKQK